MVFRGNRGGSVVSNRIKKGDLRKFNLLVGFISYLNHRRGSESDHQNMKRYTNRQLHIQFDNVTWDSLE